MIGGSRITSLTDGSKNANVANDIFDDLRDDLLRSHPWNFATKRVQLAQSTTTPAFEFDYAYPLPSDWLRTVSVHANDAGTGTVFFREELNGTQRAILSSANQLWLRYIAQITDPNLMPPDFRRAFHTALARDMAVPVAASNTLQQTMDAEAKRVLARARSADGLGSFPERRPRGSWADVRGRALPVVSDTSG